MGSTQRDNFWASHLCFSPSQAMLHHYDSTACQDALDGFADQFWRADQVGAMMAPNLEEGSNGRACFKTTDIRCHQGNIPSLAITVHEPSDVTAALEFANEKNIRVVVKCSGHEFQGRSTAPDALLIWTHEYQGVNIAEEFQACDGDEFVPSATILSGTSWHDAYAAVQAAGSYNIVGGVAYTVCASGGYVLGGGHSFMSPSNGLAVDNVLMFDVVLADGQRVNASACSNSELFWALRGGGGGTFGVILSTTYRIHPIPDDGVAGLKLSVTLLQGATTVSKLLHSFLNATPGFVSANEYGSLWGGSWTLSTTSFNIDVVFNGSVTLAQQSLHELQPYFDRHTDHFTVVTYTVTPYASAKEWHSATYSGDVVGYGVTLGSRFVPMSFCQDTTNRTIAVAALTDFTVQTGSFIGTLLGGAVAVNNASLTSTTPAFRNAAWHVFAGAAWDASTASTSATTAHFNDMTQATASFRYAFPVSGAYFSESDFLEPDWTYTFWGSNYPELQRIKQIVDPKALFRCHHCVELPETSVVSSAVTARWSILLVVACLTNLLVR
jgi:hypothetical protein